MLLLAITVNRFYILRAAMGPGSALSLLFWSRLARVLNQREADRQTLQAKEALVEGALSHWLGPTGCLLYMLPLC